MGERETQEKEVEAAKQMLKKHNQKLSTPCLEGRKHTSVRERENQSTFLSGRRKTRRKRRKKGGKRTGSPKALLAMVRTRNKSLVITNEIKKKASTP